MSGYDLISQSIEVGVQYLGMKVLKLRRRRSAFKIQTHRMFLDTNFNSPRSALSNIYQNFMEAAMKFYRYAKCIASSTLPHAGLLEGKNLTRDGNDRL